MVTRSLLPGCGNFGLPRPSKLVTTKVVKIKPVIMPLASKFVHIFILDSVFRDCVAHKLELATNHNITFT